MEHRRFWGAVKTLCKIVQSWIHVIIHWSKPIENSTPRVNPKVNCGEKINTKEGIKIGNEENIGRTSST